MSDFHRHNSWGRTRRPKNIAGPDGTAVDDQNAAPTDVDVVRDIGAISKTGDLVDITIVASDPASEGIQVGEVIHVSGNDSLKNRSFVVHSRPDVTSVIIRLPQDMRNITPLTGGKIRRRTAAGYATENQRFLHLTTAAGASVSAVWAYTYATGIWTELKLPAREVKTQSAEDADDADTNVEISIVLGASTHRVIEISGIDRLAFNIDGTVFAATSTF